MTPNLLMTSLAERACEPLQTFVETITGRSTSRLDVPGTLSQAVEAQLICDFSGVHGIGQILFVGENQKNGVSELILVQHTLQFFSGLDNTVAIVAINDEDDTLGVLEVMSPQGSDLILSTNIPYGELDVLVLDRLHVEANRGDGGHNLSKLQLVQNRGFSSSVQTDHQDSHLLLSPEPIEDLGKCETHDCGGGCGDVRVVFGLSLVLRST